MILKDFLQRVVVLYYLLGVSLTYGHTMGEIVVWKYCNPYGKVDPFVSEQRELFLGGKMIRLRQNPEQGNRPLGSVLWDGGYLLSKYLEQEYGVLGLTGKKIIELGSGTGLVGIVASLLGADVTLTDREEVLDILTENVLVNTDPTLHRVRVEKLVWEEILPPSIEQGVDFILGADVVYGENITVFKALVSVLQALSNQRTQIFIAYKPRFPTSETYFFKKANQIFQVTKISSAHLPTEFQSSVYEIYHFQLKI